MASIRNFCATSGCCSVLILRTESLPRKASGFLHERRHHHTDQPAQKSINTGSETF